MEVVLVHSNVVKNDYQQEWTSLYAFVKNKSIGQFLEISPKKIIYLETLNLEFSYIEICLTDQNSTPP